MATLILLAFALFAGTACSTPTASRIVGGNSATVEKFPSIIQVESLGTSSGIWGQSCGGNILSALYVITAAHCFHGIVYAPENRRIRAGSSYLNSGGQICYVEVEFNHPTFGLNGTDGDISVVRLLTSLLYSDVTQQGAIVPQGFIIPDNLAVVIAGWGATELGAMQSDQLQETTVYTVNNDLCVERYANLSIPQPITKNMICAGVLDVGGRDACQGDYGGPMYIGGILIGIMSWGQGCGDGTLPGVSTAVSSYTDWIVGTAV